MKIENLNALPVPSTTGAKSEAQISARERAIQALMKPNTPTQAAAQEAPVQNPTQVSPEEMSALNVNRSISKPELAQNDISETEVSQVSEEAPKTPSEPISSQYATLARKEKALRQQQQALRAREAELKAKEAALQAPKAPTIDESKYVPKDRLTADPFTVLNELGLTYDQLTELALNAPKPEQLAMMNEVRALKAEIAALKGETENTKKSFEENQKQQYTQAMNQIRNEVKHLVKIDPQFETVAATNSINDVVELIERTFNEDGILMTVEEAAQQVEEYLVEEAIKLAKLKKIQQKIAPKPAAPVQKPNSQPEQSQLKTLTNSVSSSRPLSAKERAVLAFQGKLDK